MTARTSDTERFVDTPAGVSICFRTDGDPGGTPLLLMAGLGQQLQSWPAPLVDALTGADFYVVRHDNRDIGRSSRLRHVRAPSTAEQVARRTRPEQYTLAEMALDSIAVLDAVGLDSAHVAGKSMGGMIAQTLAAQHRHRVRTLTSIFSTTGRWNVGYLSPRAMWLMMHPPRATREASEEFNVTLMRLIGSRGFPFDEAAVREAAGVAWDRGDGAHAGPGVARQIGAIFKSGDRTPELRTITAPTLVIHGDHDEMVHPSGGRATAAAIPGAHLVTVPGMGHDLPAGVWPILAELIAAHASESAPAAASAAHPAAPRAAHRGGDPGTNG